MKNKNPLAANSDSGARLDASLDAVAVPTLSGEPSFSLRHRLWRLLWMLVWTVFATWTPPQWHGWRCFLLRLFGAQIGTGVHVYSSARIWSPNNLAMEDGACLGPRARAYSMARITIGAGAIISQDAELCTGSHDIADPHFQLIVQPIEIGAGAWVAAGAFVGPGVTLGKGAVLGARAVAFKNIPACEVYAGNPARFLKKRLISQA